MHVIHVCLYSRYVHIKFHISDEMMHCKGIHVVGCVPNKQIKQYLGTKIDQFKFTTHAVVENLMLTLTDCTSC